MFEILDYLLKLVMCQDDTNSGCPDQTKLSAFLSGPALFIICQIFRIEEELAEIKYLLKIEHQMNFFISTSTHSSLLIISILF